MTGAGEVLPRLERDSVLACAALAMMALAMGSSRLEACAGVLAGGLLVAISYRGIRAGIDAIVAAATGRRGLETATGLVKFFTRYAILAAVAYVALARLRLPAVWVMAGASSFVVAVAVEALRGVASRQG